MGISKRAAAIRTWALMKMAAEESEGDALYRTPAAANNTDAWTKASPDQRKTVIGEWLRARREGQGYSRLSEYIAATGVGGGVKPLVAFSGRKSVAAGSRG